MSHAAAVGMPVAARQSWTRAPLLTACLLLCAGAPVAHAGNADTHSPAALSASYAALQHGLSSTYFERPLHLYSSAGRDRLAGDIHALLSDPFATVAGVLSRPANWCDILILHINTKYCRATVAAGGAVLNVSIGRKHDQALNEAYGVSFAYRVAVQTRAYLQVVLAADSGPLGTSNYRIVLEAMPLENGQTFIHLSYSYSFGMVGQLALQTYLSTIGRDKAGFTVIGTQADGQPRFIGGMRGLVERNTMRYYLAIEAFLGAWTAPPQDRLEKSLRDWFDATRRYPRQLHEVGREEYLDMKRREYLRQQGGLERPNTVTVRKRTEPRRPAAYALQRGRPFNIRS